MKKKEFLTEAKRKAIILEKERAIVESFAKTFNKIKRIDESTLSEEDYERASREVEYGINPYDEKPSLFDGVDKILVSRPEYNGQVMNSIYGIYIIYKDGNQEKIHSVEEFNDKFGTDIPMTKDPREVVSYLEMKHPEVTVYLDEFDVS